jgi:hypothetical protein
MQILVFFSSVLPPAHRDPGTLPLSKVWKRHQFQTRLHVRQIYTKLLLGSFSVLFPSRTKLTLSFVSRLILQNGCITGLLQKIPQTKPCADPIQSFNVNQYYGEAAKPYRPTPLARVV